MSTGPRANDCVPHLHAHVGICQRAGYANGRADALDEIAAAQPTHAAVTVGFRTKPNPDQPDRCPSIDPHDTLQCTRRIHDDDQCHCGGIAWKKGTPPYDDQFVFIGSSALLTALYETYCEHIGIPEADGPDGPYMGCGCGWRSDDLNNDNPGQSYAVHLTNAQHAAAVVALQPIVRRISPEPGGQS